MNFVCNWNWSATVCCKLCCLVRRYEFWNVKVVDYLLHYAV